MLRTDLKVFKSERMTQQADAGGQRTGNEVQNGQLNEVFGNISDIDHAQSAVDIVKVYPAVATNTTELLQDGHILVNEPPIDPLVDVVIVESPAINDGSERADIVEAIESSVVASLLLRSGLSEMLPGQDQLSALDLSQANLAGVGEQPKVTLRIGGIYCLSVEYTGNESTEWPRFQHFIKILEVNSQYIRFAPAIPYPAPGRNRTINAQTYCTKLRDTTSGAGVIYHGVTQLTATAASTVLAVEKTSGRVTPNITDAFERIGNAPFSEPDTGLIRKQVSFPAVGLTYSVPVPDLLIINGLTPCEVYYVSGGVQNNKSLSEDNIISGNVEFFFARIPDPGSNIQLRYFSTNRYSNYTYPDTKPAGYTLLMSTIKGTILRPGQIYPDTIHQYESDPTLFYTQRFGLNELITEQCVAINPADGTPLYLNGYSDLDYTALIENDSAAGEAADSAEFSMPYTEVLPATFYMTVELTAGGLLSASSDENGDISGSGVSGTISGSLVTLTFAQNVKLSTLQYAISEVVQLIPPQSLYGINQLRLPNGGAVPLFRPFGVICLSHNEYEQFPSLTAAQNISRRPNSFIDIVDAVGESLWHPMQQHYEYDKDTGEVTIVDVTGFSAPFELIDTLSELALVTNVEPTQLKISKPLQGSFPAGSIVSSVAQLGDMQARVTNIFDQETWNGTFVDVIQGGAASANYNSIDNPIEVVNNSAINERWAIHFLSSSAFRCVGENVGQVDTGDVTTDFAPINPRTGQPYFVIRSAGWGEVGAWLPGNLVRFNTVAASKPAVLLRTVSAGHSAIEQDSIRLHFRGNAQ